MTKWEKAGRFWARHDAPGAALVHPVTLTCLLTLALNDHVLKRVCPGVLSGKLSDFAGLLLLPLFLHAAFELAFTKWRRAAPAMKTCNNALIVCLAVALACFALPEVWAPADVLYRYGMGAARWPFRALSALASGRALPQLLPVQATPDLSDLLALPMAVVAYAIGRRHEAQDLGALNNSREATALAGR